VLHAVADEVAQAAPYATPAAAAPAAAAPVEPAAEPAAAPAEPNFERRTITIPPGQGLSEADLARGAAEDFIKERPWLPWVLVAFLVGYLLGKRP
jgi:hypothetical protein